MTITEIKQIQISSYLNTLSLQPYRQKATEQWYLSPLHGEATASFKVDIAKNLWFDHGIGEGGTIIDLVMKIQNLDFNQACKVLDSNNSSFSFSPVPLAASLKKEDEFEIVSVRDLKNPALIQYLESRGIDIAIAKKFSLEIFFKKKKSNGKNLFAIAFKNDEDGYETRNALYKGNIGGKAITTIKGTGNGKVAVFEGFLDFLSVLTKYNMLEITDDVIVLNSLSMCGGAKEILQGYKEVKYFFDNDKAGKTATADLMAVVGGTDYSKLYKEYKDANDWIMGIKI